MNTYKTTKEQKILKKMSKLWCEIGGKEIDLRKTYPKKEIVEYKNDIIEVEYKGKVIGLDFDEESTVQDIIWKIDIQTESGYVLKDVYLPRPTCSEDLYKEITEFKLMIKNKTQNNIGNYDWKENEKKMYNELDKLIRLERVRTSITKNMIAKYNLQNQFPLLWENLI